MGMGWSGLVLEVYVFIGRPESMPRALARSSWRASADNLCFVAAASAVSPSVINQQPHTLPQIRSISSPLTLRQLHTTSSPLTLPQLHIMSSPLTLPQIHTMSNLHLTLHQPRHPKLLMTIFGGINTAFNPFKSLSTIPPLNLNTVLPHPHPHPQILNLLINQKLVKLRQLVTLNKL